jgi:hypothetical protein
MNYRFGIFALIIAAVCATPLHADELRFSSADLRIASGSTIIIDGKTIGIAPRHIALTTNFRHKIEIKPHNGYAQMYYITAKALSKSALVDNVPAWFFNPPSLQSEFPGYLRFTPTTASSESLADAIGKAEGEAKKKLTTIAVNQYNTVRESDNGNRLDSSKSKYYPRLTRGQMDSVNDVNGGIMVKQSFGVIDRVQYLEYEIQRVDGKYQVYVLAGSRD